MSEPHGISGNFIEETSNGVPPIADVSTADTAFIDVFRDGPLNEPTRVLSFGEFEQVFGGLDAGSEASYAIQQYFANGGTAAWVIRVPNDGANALIGSEADGTGLFALDRIAPAIFNLLCIPAATNLLGAENVLATAAETCRRKRAFFLVDIPQNITTSAAMQAWKSANTGPWASNAAVYFPRLEIVDPLNSPQTRNIGSSGVLAGIYARTDAARGVWKAPAGMDATIQGATPAANVFDVQIAGLNASGINVLRSVSAAGSVAWGARTMDGADTQTSDWKYIAVRRTALFIEESLVQGLQWVVFEPNGEPLWAQIRLSVSAFLHGLFQQGAFHGATPQDAYFVKCGRDTISQSDLDNGIVNVMVGFAPLKPAEFVIIRIQFARG